MKLLMFQAKRFWFRSFQRTLDTVTEVDVEVEVAGAAVVFLHAEDKDEAQRGKVLTKALKNVKWLANKRGLKNVVLHSFTHLGGDTASPEFAQTFIEAMAERLRNTGYEVWLTPFGYVCEWDLSIYGESLAKVFKAI
jgi:hypothetical protein